MEFVMSFTLFVSLFILSIFTFTLGLSFPGLRDKRLPPGPPAFPFLGNVLYIPQRGVKFRLNEWSDTYGPFFSFTIFHGTMIVVSSAACAIELFTKRSANYCNRPPLYVIEQLVFAGDHTMLMNADSRWRLRRKLYSQLLNASKCDNKHLSLVDAEISQTLKDLIADPAGLMLHPGRMSNSIILVLDYDRVGRTGRCWSNTSIDQLPVLKHLPDRFWGNWKSRAGRLRKTMLDLYHPLVGRVIDRRQQLGVLRNSFLDQVLDQQETLNFTRNEIDVMCANLVEGGTDTVSTTLLTLFQAMVTHPEVQRKAQSQIDSVVPDTRQPCWDDYEQLPYIAMIVKEGNAAT
ncbi:cytochrome P450 [Xylariaceae sp. FL1272]|nr:cytochrome P450 [Xylariaceae sp. FL1272]